MKASAQHLRDRRILVLEIQAARARKDPDVIPSIHAALKDPSEEVQRTAEACLAEALRAISGLSLRDLNFAVEVSKALKAVDEFHPSVIPIFIDALGDSLLTLCFALQDSLVKIGEPALPALKDAVHSDNARLRANAIMPLVEIGSREQVLPLIRQCLKDENNSVRWEAILGMVSLGGEDLGRNLLEVMEDEDDSIHELAAKHIAREIDRTIPALQDALNQPNQRIVMGAIRVLAHCENQDTVNNILASLDSHLRQKAKDQIAVWQELWGRVWFHIGSEIGEATILGVMIKRDWERQPRHFKDGIETMQWIEDFRAGRCDGPIPELIISSYHMSGPNGLEICRELRQIPELSNTPIVMLTGHQISSEEGPLVKETIHHYLRRPISSKKFKATIDRAIEARLRKISGQ